MKNAKKVFSLVLVLVLALGCMATSVSATELVYPPITTITVNGYSAGLSVSGSTITYNARVPNSSIPLSNATLIVNPSTGYGATITNCSINNTPMTFSDSSYIASGITLAPANQLSISWTDYNNNSFSKNYTLNVVSGNGDADLYSLTATNYSLSFVDSRTYTIGGVTRNTVCYKLPNGTNPSALTNLELTAVPETSTSVIRLDGQIVPDGTFVANFYAQNHVLRIEDGNDAIEYMITVCAPNATGEIPMSFGVRTWAVVEFNNEDYSHFDYSYYGPGMYDPDVDDLAASIDSVGAVTGSVASPDWVYDSVSGEDRPVFLTTEYVTVWVPAGYTVMDILVDYANDNDLTVYGAEDSYVTGISSDAGTLEYMTCGWGDSWLYLVRSANNDVSAPLPNCAADIFFVTNGHYADWVFSCAFGEDLGYDIMSLS